MAVIRRVATRSVLGLLVVACSSERPSSTPPVVSAAPTSVASGPSSVPLQTASPYVPAPAWEPFGDPFVADPEVTRLTVLEHGIRLTISVEASVVRGNEPVWIQTRLENVGRNKLQWVTDGCSTHLYVEALMGFRWAYGAQQPPPFNLYKDFLLDLYRIEPRPIQLRTTPEDMVGKDEYGCADVGVRHELESGGEIQARWLLETKEPWFGHIREGLQPIPAGPVDLIGTFGAWSRGKEDPYEADRDAIEVHLPMHITEGREAELLSPGQAIDVALGAAELQAALRARPTIEAFAPWIFEYKPALERWHIGTAYNQRASSDLSAAVVVDGRTGEILDVHNTP